jgi:nucleotide-binding universal stress UspA family protein
MRASDSGMRLTLRNILFLTDFSEPSEVASPFVMALAREYGAKAYALHVLTPGAFAYVRSEADSARTDDLEKAAQAQMLRVDSQFSGLDHETMIVRGESVWSVVEQVLRDCQMGLLVVGTHGRTGAMKLLLGSVAEEIFRRASVPVLTIGPLVRTGTHSGGRFHRVLLATDFTPEARAATPYAISIAHEHRAKLLLLHVMRNPEPKKSERKAQDSVANVMHQLHEIVPEQAELWCRPEVTVRFGKPAERILEAAQEHDADLIILGVRDAAGRLGAATHLERTTAHKVVAHAACPVLTVRGINAAEIGAGTTAGEAE